MDRTQLSAIAHAQHPVMAPLSDDSVARMLDALRVAEAGSVIDVGCGFGVWLIRLLQQRPDLHGVGLDVSETALRTARAAAEDAGVAARARWELGDAAAEHAAPAKSVDAALCVGSTHALGGVDATLRTLRERLSAGGSLLLGEGFWEQPPTPAARQLFGELPELAGLVATCHEHGFQVVAGHVSTAEEWDRYEWSWVGSLTSWALDHRDSEDATAALAVAREHLDEWLAGYRGLLGFVTLVLRG